MTKPMTLEKISGCFFAFAVFLICFEPAIFFNQSYPPIFVTMIILAYVTGLPLFVKHPLDQVKHGVLSLADALIVFFPLIPLVLYLIFDLYSIKWTENPFHILDKYEVMVPFLLLLVYAIFYFFDQRISEEERRDRVHQALFAMAFAALVLALVTHFYLHIYGRTYFILRTSLQLNYNRFAQSLMLGYFCGTYLISKIENKSKYLVYVLYSLVLVPLFYTSGSRKSMVMAIPAFIWVSLPLIIEGLRAFKTRKSLIFLSLISISLVLASNQLVIRTFENRSMVVYQQMVEITPDYGDDYPSAMTQRGPGILQPFWKERPLRAVEETIESGEASGQRKVIMEIVTHRLDHFTRNEWIRGAGGSEAFLVFTSDYAKDLLKANEIEAIAHPHSFVFVDLLNGGLIKLGLTTLMILGAAILCLRFLPHHFQAFFAISAYGLVYLANEILNSGWGLQENGLTWVFLILLMGLKALDRQSKEKA